MFAINIKNLKKLKYYIILKKTLSLSIIYSKVGNMKKYLKKKNQLKNYKILVYLIIQKSIKKYIIMPEENINQEFGLKK